MYARLFSERTSLPIALIAVFLSLFLVMSNTAFAHSLSGGGFYSQTNLTSDLPGVANNTDPRLVNPWGISFAPTNAFWISDNNSGLSTLYNGHGKRQTLVVTVPPAKGSKMGSPTGTVFSSFSSAFMVTENGVSGPSGFLFDSEDGTISGWNALVDQTHAILAVDNSRSGAVYKGLAIAAINSQPYLYAANFYAGTIDVFDKNFAPAKLRGSFHDSAIPQGYAPFNVQSIGTNLYVTYAQQDKARHDSVSGCGRGFLDVFTDDGLLLKHLVSRSQLNAPWGVALAPANFGQYSNDLLVGNFGDGAINAFNPANGTFLGTLLNSQGKAIHIDGLWALAFGSGGESGKPNQLFFTAGIQHEQHGLFGMIEAN